MARIRSIKPEIWDDEDLAGVSETAMLLAIGLLNHADDEGYFKANIALVKKTVFPLREPSVSIHGALTELSNIGFIRLCEGTDGKKYGHVVNFVKHQKVNRPTVSKIKGLCEFTEPSVSIHGALTEPSLPEQGTGNREQGTGKGKNSARAPNALFEKFWEAFDDKRGKEPAFKSWEKINPDSALADKIIAGAEAYANWRKTIKPKDQTGKMAQGWLTDRRWEDDLSGVAKPRYAEREEDWENVREVF